MTRHRPLFLFMLVSILSLLLMACQSNQTPTAGSFTGGDAPDTAVVATAETPSWSPTINLSQSAGGPASTITVIGIDFPPDQLVLIRLDTAESMSDDTPVYTQVTSDGFGTFEQEVTLPIVWPPTTTAVPGNAETVLLELEATTPAVGEAATPARATFTLDYSDAFQTVRDDTAGFSFQMPAEWEISDPQITPLGELRLFGAPPIMAGNPATNLLLVANAAELDAVGAAEQLQCGGGCADEVAAALTAVEIGDVPAQQIIIGGNGLPELSWYFIEHAGRLIYFTLNDPTTLASLTPLINSLELGEAVALQPSPTPTATATPEPEPTMTPEPEPTSAPTVTAEPENEEVVVRDEGPLETTVNFLIDVTRLEITPASLDRLAPELRQQAGSVTAVLALLQVDEPFVGINAGRLNGPEVVVRAELTRGNDAYIRLFTLQQGEEDGVWRIVAIDLEEEPATAESGEETEENENGDAPTPTPELEEGTGEATATPEEEDGDE